MGIGDPVYCNQEAEESFYWHDVVYEDQVSLAALHFAGQVQGCYKVLYDEEGISTEESFMYLLCSIRNEWFWWQISLIAADGSWDSAWISKAIAGVS